MIRKIRLLKQLGPRPDWIMSSRDLLLSEIRRQSSTPVTAPATSSAMGLGHVLAHALGWVRQPLVGFVGALGLILATSLTVNAAFYSLPGNPLYRMKLTFERTQLAFVSDSARKAELKVEFAKNRVKELAQMVSQSGAARTTSHKQVSRVVGRFTQEVSSMHRDLQRRPTNQRAVFKIAVSVGQAGSELEQQVQAELASEEPEVTEAVRVALAAAEATSDLALSAAIVPTTHATSSEELPPAGEVQKLLEEKIARLEEKINALTPAGDVPDTALLELLEPLNAAKLDTTNGDFVSALAKISAVREALGAIAADFGAGDPVPTEPEVSDPPDGGQSSSDGTATTSEAVGDSAETSDTGVETTNDLLPQNS